MQNRAKKVRISLFDTRKRVQIILKRLGDDDSKRFGSLSISLKKLAQGMGNSYLHWCTLFDTLDDDLYDGQLGEDDWETPRILLEYGIIGGEYTGVRQGIEKLRNEVDNQI